MTTAVATRLAVAELSGSLSPAGDKLRVRLPSGTAAELWNAIRSHKAALTTLVELERRRQWRMVRSAVLGGEVVFFAVDKVVKANLVSMGAHPECVYTRDELAELVRLGVEPGSLLAIHEARRVFGGKVVPPPFGGRGI